MIWEEFNLERKLGTIPPHRMRANREHVVPLRARAIAIVERCAELGDREASCKKGLPLSDNSSAS
ncbi:hypothetical protein SKP52_07860 [Sphingopyxis fribergensis]|uniref:Uncharacterized protein n=1 Tax=Sphingopyxis fribergensis TaxID=1515612 RepID=A0A0A7PEF4_9SPHN|nr:hypothetical protein [Sphingopyxis fribergensis]AJA08491.1 hypothetical protein SKP52_07860 [Sphingopyxis fribergensis]